MKKTQTKPSSSQAIYYKKRALLERIKWYLHTYKRQVVCTKFEIWKNRFIPTYFECILYEKFLYKKISINYIFFIGTKMAVNDLFSNINHLSIRNTYRQLWSWYSKYIHYEFKGKKLINFEIEPKITLFSSFLAQCVWYVGGGGGFII